MVKKCIELNCNKQPSYNYDENKCPIYCVSHKKDNMINVISKRCLEYLCITNPIFNYKGENAGIYCYKHKKDDMINVKCKYCSEINCNKSGRFGYSNDKNTLYCMMHKSNDMINMKSKCCNEVNCFIRPSFNFDGMKYPLYCVMHKKAGMIDVIHPPCRYLNCTLRPHFNYKGQKEGLYCMKHKLEGMINITEKRCKTHLCDIQVSNKYNGYCLRCYIHLFPDNKISQNYKTKENAVSAYIIKIYADRTVIVDKKVTDGCSKRRPDILIDLGYQVIICEIDENQHINYDCSCENKRLMEISQDVGFRPIIFIRFNPDDYLDKDNNNITSCWSINKKGISVISKKKTKEWNSRLEVLKETINYWTENKLDKTIEVIQLFYNQNNCN